MIPVVIGAGGLSYVLARRLLSDEPRSGDSCSIDVYRRILGPHTTQKVVERAWNYMPYVRGYAARFGVEWTLLAGLIQTESKWNPAAGSSSGAVGLAQFTNSTAKSVQRRLADSGQWPFATLDRSDPQQSIWLGAAHLGSLLRKYDLETALAAYNAGPKVIGQPSSQWPSETRNYVPGVLRRQGWFRKLEEAC